jgi:uncharacterized Zn-finger protein
MVGDESVILVESSPVRCTGGSDRVHEPVTLDVAADAVAVCPVCSRRFRRGQDPEAIGLAVWPRPE